MDENEPLPPADAFALVGHDLRFRILDALSRADDALAFSELRERVGVEDPGQFNYHLGKLAGRFVRDTGDAYTTTTAGDRVVGAVRSGGLTRTIDRDSIDLDADCPRCGSPLELGFAASHAHVACDDCGFTVLNVTVPAGVLDAVDRDAIPGVVDRWQERTMAALDAGFCLYCDAPLDVRVLPAGDPGTPDWVGDNDYGAAVRYECGECESDWLTSVASALLHRPSVVAFHYDHDLNLRENPVWEQNVVARSDGRVAARDPLRVDVTYRLDGDELTVTVDETLDVVDAARA